MKRLKIAIDCDDVVVPTASLILNHYNKTYGTSIALKDFYSRDLTIWEVSDSQVAVKRVEDYMTGEEYQTASPFLDAIEVIRELSHHHDLHIVTGRADALTTATKHMLTQHFPEMFKSIEFTNFFSQTPHPKADVCKELGVDFLIDDHLHHATTVAACGIDVLLFGNYPWNRSDTLPANITRVEDWHEVANLLLKK